MNKKLIKTITCITCGLGIASSIPFMSTSCGGAQKDKVLPDIVYEYDPNDSTILTGFSKDFLDSPNKYSYCDTMLIPSDVKEIAANAFISEESFYLGYDNPIIPHFLKTLKFSKNDSTISLGNFCFSFNSFENVYLPDKFNFGEDNVYRPFAFSQNLKHIYLNENTQDQFIYSKSFGDDCQVITTKVQEDKGSVRVVGGLATGFLDFTKDPTITKILEKDFSYCSSINGFKFSKNIENGGIEQHSFDFCTGLDANKLSFEEDSKNYGFATNLGGGKLLVRNSGTSDDPKFIYQGNNNYGLVAGDIDYRECTSDSPNTFEWSSVSSIIFNDQFKKIEEGFTVFGNKQLKSITFNYVEGQNLEPSEETFIVNPNLKYIEFNGYPGKIADFANYFKLNENNKTCFDYIGRGGKIKALNCGFSSDELLNFLKSKTHSDWDPFKDWQVA